MKTFLCYNCPIPEPKMRRMRNVKLTFNCGVCGKQETLELSDKNKTYIIGRDIDGLDVKLCSDEKSRLSRIQAHIKWDRNNWRIFDGWPPESVSKQETKISKASMAGTFMKRSTEKIGRASCRER